MSYASHWRYPKRLGAESPSKWQKYSDVISDDQRVRIWALKSKSTHPGHRATRNKRRIMTEAHWDLIQNWYKLKTHSMLSRRRRWERSLEHRALMWLLNKWDSLVVCGRVYGGPSSMWGMISGSSPPYSWRKGLSLDTELTAHTGRPTSTGDLPTLPPLQWDYKGCALRSWPGCQKSKLLLAQHVFSCWAISPGPQNPKYGEGKVLRVTSSYGFNNHSLQCFIILHKTNGVQEIFII